MSQVAPLSQYQLLLHEQVEQSKRDERSLQVLLQSLLKKLNESSFERQEYSDQVNRTKKTIKHISARLNIAEQANKTIETQIQNYRDQISGSLLSEIAQQRDHIDRQSQELYEDLRAVLAQSDVGQDLKQKNQLTKQQKQQVRKAEQALQTHKKQLHNVQTKWLKMIQDSMRIKTRSGVLEDQLVQMIVADLHKQCQEVIQAEEDGGKLALVHDRLKTLQRKQEVRDMDHSNRMRELRTEVARLKLEVSSLRKQSNSLSYGVKSVLARSTQQQQQQQQSFQQQESEYVTPYCSPEIQVAENGYFIKDNVQQNGRRSAGNYPIQPHQDQRYTQNTPVQIQPQHRSRSVDYRLNNVGSVQSWAASRQRAAIPPARETPSPQPLSWNRKSSQTVSWKGNPQQQQQLSTSSWKGDNYGQGSSQQYPSPNPQYGRGNTPSPEPFPPSPTPVLDKPPPQTISSKGRIPSQISSSNFRVGYVQDVNQHPYVLAKQQYNGSNRTSGVTSSIPTIPTPPHSNKKLPQTSRTHSTYVSRPRSRVSDSNSHSTSRMSVFSRESFWENMVRNSSPLQARSTNYTDPKQQRNKEELVKQLHRVKSLLSYDMQISQES